MKAIKDSAIYLVGELISKAMPFLLLPYLSRKLGVEGFGQLSYFQVYLAAFFIFIGLNQDGALMRYFYFYGKRSINLIVSASSLYTIGISSCLLLFFIFYKSEVFIYIILACMMQSLIAVQLSLHQCQKKALSYSIIQISLAVLITLFTILLLEVYEDNLVEKRILAIFISHFLLFIFIKIFTKSKSKKFTYKNYKSAIYYLLVFGLPLILHNLSGVLKGHLDRLFIYHRFSEYELGLYAMGATLASIISILLMAMNKALNPYYFELIKNNRIDLYDIYKYVLYSFLIIPFFIFLISLIPEVFFTLILGDKFKGVRYFFLVFSLANILNIAYILLANYLYFYGKTKEIALCSILSLLIYILSILILSKLGIDYIPFASVIGILSIIPILILITYKTSKRIK